MSAKRVSLVLLLLLSISTGAAPAPVGDVARLQGRWETRVGAKKEIAVVLEVKGCRVSAVITTPVGLKVQASGELKVDESASPKALDWVRFKTADGNEIPELHAIYRLDGDRFTLRSGGFSDDRPTGFEPGDGIWAEVLVFERP